MELSMLTGCCSATTIIMAITAVLTLLYFISTKRPKNFPPGPVGLPLVGYFPFLGENGAETLRKLKLKYGSVMSVQLGREIWIILNDYDTINEAFVKQADKFSGRPNNFMFNLWTDGYGIAVSDYGKEYKTLKKFGLTTLRGFGVGKIGIEENIVEESSFLIENLSTKNNTSLRKKVALSVSNIICRVAFGTRLSYDDKRLNIMLDVVQEIFSDSPTAKMFGLFTAAPELRFIPPFNIGLKKILQKKETFFNVVRGIIDEHRKTYDENNIRDVIDAFLKEMKATGGNNTAFSEGHLLQLMRDLFEEGTGTSTSLMMWFFLCFANYPEYQEKIFNEIKMVVGDSETPRMKHRDEMHYTRAFMQELARHRTVLPLAVFHKTNEEATLSGYTIPKNTTVSANLWAGHHDPDIFENPSEFQPERFLDKDGKYIESKYVIPFSIGQRFCIGKQIAKVELFVYLTSIVQKLKIVPCKSSPVPSFHEGAFNMVTLEPPAFDVEFEKR